MKFTIRNEQKDAFAESAQRQFERTAVEHLRKEMTEQVKKFSDEQLRVWVREAIVRAQRFGLVTQRQIMCFLDSEVLLGKRFYESAQDAWADKVLRSDQLVGNDKAGLLLATACSVYRERSGGGKA